MSDPKTRRWAGAAAPISARDPRVAALGPGPEAAAEMLCRLKQDAQQLTRKLDETKRQNAEAVTLLASINAIMREQQNDAENIMAEARENTDRIVAAVGEAVAAIRDLCQALARGSETAREPGRQG